MNNEYLDGQGVSKWKILMTRSNSQIIPLIYWIKLNLAKEHTASASHLSMPPAEFGPEWSE